MSSLDFKSLLLNQPNKRIYTCIFSGCSEAITGLDLSPNNLKVYQYDSESFAEFLAMISANENSLHDAQNVYKTFYENYFDGNMYILAPIDILNPPSLDHYIRLFNILLMVFPSNFKMNSIEYFFVNTGENAEKYHFVLQENYSRFSIHGPDFGRAEIDKISEISEFINLVLTRPKLPCVEFAVQYYQSAFYQLSLEMAYVNFCIALESLVDSSSEVTHQISRLCAVVNSKSKEEGEVIYTNTKKMYSLRSKIVHGEKFELNVEYFKMMMSLVSRTLIQLLLHGVADKKVLNRFVQASGYGDFEGCSGTTYNYVLNRDTCDRLRKRLPK